MRKVHNPCNRSYKRRCFLPCGNNTSPILMFMSLKLDIGGHELTIMHNAPSWSSNLLLGQSNKKQWRTCNNYSRTKIQKDKNQIYNSSQSEHNLIIHQIPANSA